MPSLVLQNNQYVGGFSPQMQAAIFIPKTVSTTSTVAASLIDHALAAGTMIGGECVGVVYCSDGTDYQARHFNILYSAANKAGAISTTATIVGQGVAASAGTLTITAAATAGSSKVTLDITPTTSLTATLLEIRYVIRNLSIYPQTILNA